MLFIVAAFYNELIKRKYTVKTSKIPKSSTVRVVLITDLHSTVHGKNQQNIKNIIEDANPDLIALSGDIADDIFPIGGTKLFLEAVQDIAPIYYVTGNHEIRSGKQEEIKRLFKSFNVNILENEVEEIDVNGAKLVIAGVDDPDIIKAVRPESDWHEEIQESFTDLDQLEGYKILLSHRPEQVKFYNTLGFDMVLSGHAHGGQVRIPFLINGLYAPNQGVFPKFAGGMYEHKNFTHIVSRGTSFYQTRPRIFNRPEVVVIDIKGK